MLFTSQLFIFIFLPFCCLSIFLANRFLTKKISILVMIALSFVFYYFNGHAQLQVLIASIAINHVLISIMMKSTNDKKKNYITACTIIINILALIYYKYGTFLIKQYESLSLVIGSNIPFSSWADYINGYNALYPWGYSGEMIILPLGISFFTFQQIAYLLDLRSGHVKKHNFIDYLFCVSFFPHLIAGPIVNYRELIPQLKNNKILTLKGINFTVGLSIFVVGLFKKCIIADSLGEIANPIFNTTAHGVQPDFISAWGAALAYTFQIYFDFSGYSDMAIGLARIFGLKLPVNFASPYKSSSIIEFWQRWHITLSRFLRSYVYIPLGGNRKGHFKRYRNLLLTMTIGGLWHGAAWTFVIWGVLHGVLLTINHFWRFLVEKIPYLRAMMPKWFAKTLTMICVIILWVFFRSNSCQEAIKIIVAMFNPTSEILNIATYSPKYILIIISAFIAFHTPTTQQLFSRYHIAIPPDNLPIYNNNHLIWRNSLFWLLGTALLAGIACFYSTDFPKFLYWNF